MRLNELVLERYGAVENRRLSFDGPGLMVVYGANEAGKSTCLSAIADFLFRIPERSPRASLFGSDVMRIGATLTTADGRELRLRRRAGRVRTLMDDAGAPCEEAVLSGLLGATTRERFEHLFGLDHESLRDGGDQLLRADGEIGRLIVEAGGGLRNLMSRLDALDEELDGLFSPKGRGDKRAFNRALHAYDAADKTARVAILTRDVYERDRKALTAAEASLERHRADRRSLAQDLSRLQRIERVVPALRDLARVEENQQAFTALAHLPDTFPEACLTALDTLATAEQEHSEAEERAGGVSTRVEALVLDAALLAAETQVRAVGSDAAKVEGARASRANRQSELNESETLLSRLLQRLQLQSSDDLEPLMPAPEIEDRVRSLADQALERRPALVAAEEAAVMARDLLDATQARLAAEAQSGRDAPFGLSALAFATLPSSWAALQKRVALSDRAEKAHVLGTSALGFASVEALRDLICPTPDQLRGEIEKQGALQADVARLSVLEAAAARDQAAAEEDIERLRLSGEIATDEALASARVARGAAWIPIREAHLAGRCESPDAVRAEEVTALETELAHADRLSDARTNEAQRVASLLEIERRLRDAERARAAAAEEARAAAKALAERRAEFRGAFSDAHAVRPDLGALLTLSEARLDLIEDMAQTAAARAELEIASAQLEPTLQQLAEAERQARLTVEEAAPLAVRVERISQAITRHDKAHDDHMRDLRDRAVQVDALASANRVLIRLQGEQREWAGEWASAMAALAQDADTKPETGAALANLWTGARGELRSRSQTQRRLTRMDEDEAKLSAEVGALAAKLGIMVPADPVAASQMLTDRWRAAEGVRQRREALVPELEVAKSILAGRRAAITAARARLDSLATEAAVALGDLAALRAISDQKRAAVELQAERLQMEASARAAGDGLDVASLREDCKDTDLDGVRAELAEVQRRIGDLDGELERTIREAQRAGDALLQHDAPSAVAGAIVERESATADMHASVSRYVELKLARDLVGQAIQRVRSEQQDPLIREAGGLFARMTRGEFSGVAADVDVKGAPVVVGVRPGDRTEPVASMSDGTRDQLFLAFRLASLKTYCAAAEPLPFIADDILVHFDDPRGEATLNLLSEFCGVTQVLLFTHHLSVREAGRKLMEAGRATVVDLGT